MNIENKIDRRALFADETEEFRVPAEAGAGETVVFLFRTGKSDDLRVFLTEAEGDRELLMRKREAEDPRFDFYETELSLGEEPFRYLFRVEQEGETLYYQRNGVTKEPDRKAAFAMVPGFTVPEWAKGAIMYQIFVDRFCNGDPTNDVRDGEYIYVNRLPVRKVENWNSYPTALDVNNFYGGDLQGVWEKLDYLKNLGVQVIYFNPLFVSPSNHKYDSQDYDHIDPHYGVIVKDAALEIHPGMENHTAEAYITRVTSPENLSASNLFFAKLVEEIHKRGMRVILDGVFNHCGSFNKWMDHERLYEKRPEYEKGAYITEDSPYKDFFGFTGGNWPYNDEYEGWWGYKTLPKLNYEGSEELCEYILGIGRKWVSEPYNCDGWRLDVAADLGHSPEFNHAFWKRFRKAVKEANPEAIILAEHYGNPEAWLQGDEWDTVMNYDAFMEPLTFFLTGMEKHSDFFYEEKRGDGKLFFETMRREMSRFHLPSLQTAMNELSNHDHSRFLTRTNMTVGRTATHGPEAADKGVRKDILRQAVVMQMTWPGAPTIYYGDEAGMCGWTDPDNRRTYPWGREDLELIEFHRYMTDIHRRNPALKTGSFKELIGEKDLVVYGRFRGDNRLVIAVNTAKEVKHVQIPVWEIGMGDASEVVRLMKTGGNTYNSGRQIFTVKNGCLEAEIPAEGSVIFAESDDGLSPAGEQL